MNSGRPAASESEGADDTIVSREPRREGQKRVEWPDQQGQQTENEDVKTPTTVAEIDGVIICGLCVVRAFLTHVIFF